MEMLGLLENSIRTTGTVPSFDEMSVALGLNSKSAVHRLVSALEERGFIRRIPNRARAIEVLKSLPNAVDPQASDIEAARRLSINELEEIITDKKKIAA
jgi:repressor LexA